MLFVCFSILLFFFSFGCFFVCLFVFWFCFVFFSFGCFFVCLFFVVVFIFVLLLFCFLAFFTMKLLSCFNNQPLNCSFDDYHSLTQLPHSASLFWAVTYKLYAYNSLSRNDIEVDAGPMVSDVLGNLPLLHTF